jgi:hypothetical protein
MTMDVTKADSQEKLIGRYGRLNMALLLGVVIGPLLSILLLKRSTTLPLRAFSALLLLTLFIGWVA